MKNINIEQNSLYNKSKKVRNKVLRRFSAFEGTGSDLTACTSYDDALRLAGLTYTAEKQPVFLGQKVGEETNYLEIKDQFACVKIDENPVEGKVPAVLGIVGKQYQCVSNRDAFSVAEELFEEDIARFEVGGAVIGAQKKTDYSQTFLVMRGDDFNVADEPFNSFTILRNSFDGSTGVNFQVVCQRVWCENMATRYLGGKKNQLRVNIQHSSSALERIEQAKKIVMKRNEDILMVQREAEAFIGTKYTRAQFEKNVLPLILKEMKLVEEGKDRQRGQERIENVVQLALSAYDAEDTQNFNGTAYKVILAISDLETHMPALKDTNNPSLYIGRVAKGMLLTSAVANMIASQANFDMRRFQN